MENGKNNFQNCQLKTTEEIVKRKQNCCGITESKGFECLKKNIFPLFPQICINCLDFNLISGSFQL